MYAFVELCKAEAGFTGSATFSNYVFFSDSIVSIRFSYSQTGL